MEEKKILKAQEYVPTKFAGVLNPHFIKGGEFTNVAPSASKIIRPQIIGPKLRVKANVEYPSTVEVAVFKGMKKEFHDVSALDMKHNRIIHTKALINRPNYVRERKIMSVSHPHEFEFNLNTGKKIEKIIPKKELHGISDCKNCKPAKMYPVNKNGGLIIDDGKKPSPKPEPKPAPKPEPKPEPKPSPKPEPKPEPKPAPKPEPKPAPKPEPKPAPKPEPKPAPKPEPTPAPIPEPTPSPKPEPKKEEKKEEPKSAPKKEEKKEESKPAPKKEEKKARKDNNLRKKKENPEISKILEKKNKDENENLKNKKIKKQVDKVNNQEKKME